MATSVDIPQEPAPLVVEDGTESVKISSDAKASKRKSACLPVETVEYLKAWMMSPEHIAHPYPTEQEKGQIMAATGIEVKQLTNWFVNNRKRYWKPRVEARLQQQAQAAQAAAQVHAAAVVAVSTAAVVRTSPVTPDNSVKKITSAPLKDETYNCDLPGGQNSSLSTNLLQLFARSTEQMTVSPSASVHNISETSSSASSCSLDGAESRYPDDARANSATVSVTETSSVQETVDDISTPTVALKRKVTEESPDRKKFRRVSLDVWRESCLSANDAYCESLPSLEEATQMFGY